MSTVLWMPSALEDLRSIQDYISRDSVFYANKFVDEAFSSTEKLELFPEIGRIVPELGVASVREIFHGSYRIIYELINNEVRVVAMVHGKRLLPSISHTLFIAPSDDD